MGVGVLVGRGGDPRSRPLIREFPTDKMVTFFNNSIEREHFQLNPHYLIVFFSRLANYYTIYAIYLMFNHQSKQSK